MRLVRFLSFWVLLDKMVPSLSDIAKFKVIGDVELEELTHGKEQRTYHARLNIGISYDLLDGTHNFANTPVEIRIPLSPKEYDYLRKQVEQGNKGAKLGLEGNLTTFLQYRKHYRDRH